MFKKSLAANLFAAAFACVLPVARADETVLRVVPQSDLKILDPIWTTAAVTGNHGYAIYDTLFAVNAQGSIKPQMVRDYSHSADGKSWTFTLRDGLAFHDDTPVTSADVIASIKRWGQRDILGQKLMAAIDSLVAKNDKTIVLTVKEPFAIVLEALGKPDTNALFIMPKAVAETPADQQINNFIGSGPFIFKADEYRPGEKVVYVKNKKYVPRKEPASGLAGGKVVNVDRMEWMILNDPQTQANALSKGEVDMIEIVPSEQVTALKSNPKVDLAVVQPANFLTLQLNRLIPPFNNVKIAQAAFMAVNQEAIMRAQVGIKGLYNTNPSIYPIGSAYASDKTSYFTGVPQFERAQALLKEAGYKGEPIVFMNPASFSLLNKAPPVMAALLRQAGFNVDLQSMDWSTLVSRRALKKPASEGGWNAFITGWKDSHIVNPLYFAPLTGNGEQGWFGWATDAALERLKGEMIAASDEATRKALATKIQGRVFDAAIFAPLGDATVMTAYRKGVISGIVTAPPAVFWGVKKN